MAALAGKPTAARWGAVVSARSQGHPFFARELTSVLAAGGAVAGVPAAIRELVARRLARLTADCARLLEACAVAGASTQPDVLADAMGQEPARVAELVEEAVAGGVLAPAADADPAGVSEQGVRFGHDLYRESIYASLARTQLVDLHRRVGEALVRRRGRGATVFRPSWLAISPRPPQSPARSRHLPGPDGPQPPMMHGSRTRTRPVISSELARLSPTPVCRCPMPTWSTC